MKTLLLSASFFFLASLASQAATPTTTVDTTGNVVVPAAAPVSATVTRPANTTTYTANTGWANATSGATYSTWTKACRNTGGTAYLDVGVIDYANQATKLSGTIFVFAAPPTAPISDGATFSIAAADAANLATTAPLSFAASTVLNQGSGAAGITSGQATPPIGQFVTAHCAPGSTSLYLMVEVTNAYAPVSGEVLVVYGDNVQVN